MVYRHKNTSGVQDKTCCVCSTKRKHEHSSKEASKFVPCPSPKFVESFLADTIGFESHISENDVLCFRCYKYFNQLLKSGACTLSNAHIQAERVSLKGNISEMVQILTDTIRPMSRQCNWHCTKQYYMCIGLSAQIVQYCFQTYTGYS